MRVSKAVSQAAIDWARIQRLNLPKDTALSLASFRKRTEDARRQVAALREAKTEVDFAHYRSVLKNQDVVGEAEKALNSFKPEEYDVQAQLKAIDAFKQKALESARATAGKIDTELRDLQETLGNIEQARAFDQLSVDEVSAAQPAISKAVEESLRKGKWTVPGYHEKFGNLSSEFPHPADKRLAFISGFTGYGFALITHSSAYIFTGGKRFLFCFGPSQARTEIDENWELVEITAAHPENWPEWLLENGEGWRIGLDGRLCPYVYLSAIEKKLERKGITLVLDEENSIDQIWENRPSRSQKKLFIQDLKYSGKPASEKLFDLWQWLSAQSSESAFIISSLQDIAWLLNLRGEDDIPYSPLFFSYLLLQRTGTTLFVDEEKIDDAVRKYLDGLKIRTRPYEEFESGLKELNFFISVLSATDLSYSFGKALIQGVPRRHDLTFIASPVTAAKAVKNKTEIDGFRTGYLRDAVAWARWAGWLEEFVKEGGMINEHDAGARLDAYRALQDNFVGLAYPNVSATGRNAALPHYFPLPEAKGDIVNRTSPYLNDSGAQYRDCTIDTTRTTHFGNPTKEVKQTFTRVLQGHIAIDSVVFPEGVTGYQLDILERKKLWQDGLDYPHGSGHGIGSFNMQAYLPPLKGPAGLAMSRNYDVPFKAGHTTTNEPGYYVEGHFGIRIESFLHCVETGKTTSLGQKLLGFERFTLALITRWSAYLFAGGFYFSQAKSELDENWVLIEVNARQTDWSHWLLENAEEWRVGMDANLFPYLYLNNIVDTLKKKNIDVILDEKNLIDQVWAERPLKSKKKIYLQELQYSGKASAQKLFDLRQWLSAQFSDSTLVITSLQDIAWLLNLRGSGDIPYSPLFYAHFIISPTESTLFLDEEKIDRKIRNYLDALNVRTRPYEEIAQGFGELKSKTVFSGTDLSYALAKIAKEIPGVELRFVASPVTAAKAVKNKQEIEGFRAGYLRDAASWARWAGWLEEAIRSHEKINEYEAGARLDAYRALQDKFVSLGGSSISATGRNAAFPFYSPSLQSQGDVLDKISPYLNDSGAQYLDSTTDTTRTMHFGKPSQEVKRAFTRVLQGHIAVDSAVFPEGVTGFQLDILERTKLWQDGLDYPHGSGHGVGNFNSSHEGPIGIGKSRAWDSVPLQAGHTITNEPGLLSITLMETVQEVTSIVQVIISRTTSGFVWKVTFFA
ncbi:Creatinase/aminopeptidase [Atractiella rhizophila]|nr:Creatinase/aminopeptidase [Atractiella rhizophila]